MNDDTPLALGELYDFLIKFILIGDSASGKSCLLNSFLTDNCIFLFFSSLSYLLYHYDYAILTLI
jgi:hypothetical protein